MLTEKLIREAGVHIALPAPVQANLDRLDDLRAQKRELEAVSPVDAVSAIVRGKPALEAVLERRNADADRDAHAEALQSLNQAIDAIANISMGHLVRATTATAEAFIAGPLREKFTAMVDNARPAAEALAKYAPRFDTDQILKTADPKAIKLFQATVADAVSFDVLYGYWFQLLSALLPGRAGGKHGTYAQAGWLLPPDARVGGVMVWAHPEHVTDDIVRGRYLRTNPSDRNDAYEALVNLLAVAAQPPQGEFRLCTPPELLAAFNAQTRARVEREHRTHRPVSIHQHVPA